MVHAMKAVMVGAGLVLTGTSYAGFDFAGSPFKQLITGQSKQPGQSGEFMERQKVPSGQAQEPPSHSEFGEAPTDQKTRDRQHSRYSESVRNVGPQEEDQGQGSKGPGGGGKPRPGHEQQSKSKDAASGMGK